MSKQTHCANCNCIVACDCGKHSVPASSGVQLEDHNGQAEVHTADQCWREVVRMEIIRNPAAK